MNFYEWLNVIDDDVCSTIYYVNEKLYECLNVIDDDVYDATHCENVN